MKKIAAILLTVLMVISLGACGGEKKTTEERMPDSGNTQQNSTGDAASTGDDSAGDDSTDNDSVENTLPEVTSNILVAYFSATNTTEGVAEMIADSLSADLYEIVPEQPYTDADLNYHDDNSRSTIEMNDSSARPAITDSVEDMGQYSIVFIGYPIWWSEAPRIVSTFVESYEFSGKTIVPFCTSGGSGVGSSATNLEKLTSGANWLPGTRLNGGSSRETIVDWVNGLGLDIKAE